MADSVDKAYAIMREHLAKKSMPVVFEIGMCDGYHTRMMLEWCPNPVYHGFEPDPRNVERISRSGLREKIIFHAGAVGNVTGKTNFNLATPEPNGCVGASSLSEFTPVLTANWPWLKCQETISVPSWTLDDFCEIHKIGAIDFIWMDVQGAEKLVFEGASRMLAKTGLIWTEYDSGTFYKDSSNLKGILKYFPGWPIMADCGGDVLIKNPNVFPE